MADQKISDLPALAAVDPADELAVVDTSAGETKRATKGTLFANPTFTGSVTVPTATTSDQATTKGQVDAALALKAPLATPITLGAAALGLVLGAPSLDRVNFRQPAWLLDSSLNEWVGAETLVPASWATVNLHLWWCNVGAGSGDVVFAGSGKSIEAGETLNASGTNIIPVTVTSPAQYVAGRTTIYYGFPVTPGELLWLRFGRNGTDAADTLGNDIGLLALEITRAS